MKIIIATLLVILAVSAQELSVEGEDCFANSFCESDCCYDSVCQSSDVCQAEEARLKNLINEKLGRFLSNKVSSIQDLEILDDEITTFFGRLDDRAQPLVLLDTTTSAEEGQKAAEDAQENNLLLIIGIVVLGILGIIAGYLIFRHFCKGTVDEGAYALSNAISQ